MCEPEVIPAWAKWFLFMALIGAPAILTVIILTLAWMKKTGLYNGE